MHDRVMGLRCLVVDDSPHFLAALIAGSPAVGFIPKISLSAGAIRDLLAPRTPRGR